MPLDDVEPAVGRDDRLGERLVAPRKRRDGVGKHLLADPAHLGDGGAEMLELRIE